MGDFNSRSHSVAIKPKIDLRHMYKLTENAQAFKLRVRNLYTSPFLRFTVTLAAGVPTEFTFNGRLEIGHDCGADDFKVEGRCFAGEALVGISANPAKQYVYGELSPVTIGKILRMLGSKLQLPPAVEQSGFPKGLTVSTLKCHHAKRFFPDGYIGKTARSLCTPIKEP